MFDMIWVDFLPVHSFFTGFTLKSLLSEWFWGVFECSLRDGFKIFPLWCMCTSACAFRSSSVLYAIRILIFLSLYLKKILLASCSFWIFDHLLLEKFDIFLNIWWRFWLRSLKQNAAQNWNAFVLVRIQNDSRMNKLMKRFL